jgi:hypothetical protein
MERHADHWPASLPESLHPEVARPFGLLEDAGFKVVPANEIPQL